jgi:hypothetical protein
MKFPPFLQTDEAARLSANAQSPDDTEQFFSNALDFIGKDGESQASLIPHMIEGRFIAW